MKVPLADVVRPNGSRDEAGAVGESMHYLADFLEKHFPEEYIEIENVEQKPERKHWQQVVEQLSRIRDTSDENFHPAINRIVELAT